MKKVLIFCVAVAVAVTATLLCACNDTGDFLCKYVSYSDADLYTKGGGEFDLSSVNSIEIDWIHDAVKIISSDAVEKITISEENNKEEDELQMRHYLDADGKLRIKYVASGASLANKTIDWIKKLTITLPANADKKYEKIDIDVVSANIDVALGKANELKIDSVSGKVEIKDSEVDEADVKSISGDLIEKNCVMGKMELSTVSGAINFEGAVNGDAKVSTTSGAVDLKGKVSGEINVDTTSGASTLELTEMPKSIDYDTISGNFTIRIPDNSGFTVIFDTVSGSFNTNEFALTQQNDKYSYGDGAVKIKVNSVSGNFSIKKRA